MGGAIVKACESQVENILAHFLKLEFSGLEEPQRHWRAEIDAFRAELEKDITPTIAARMPGRLDHIYRYALRAVRRDYDRRGEEAPILPEACPYSWDDALGRGGDWTPAPRL